MILSLKSNLCIVMTGNIAFNDGLKKKSYIKKETSLYINPNIGNKRVIE